MLDNNGVCAAQAFQVRGAFDDTLCRALSTTDARCILPDNVSRLVNCSDSLALLDTS